jgi:cytoskeletal protein RodZ
MPTLGEELKSRREQRGISLAEISETTRIGTRFLKAIETDNFAILPGGIFTRSFIRAFAKHVGMNEDDAVGLYLRQVAGGTVEPETTGESTPAAPATETTKRPPPKLVVPKPVIPESSRRFEPVTFRPSPARTNWSTVVIGGGIVIFVVIIVIALVKQLNQGTSDTASQTTSAPARTAPPKPASPNTQPAPQPSGAAAQPAATTPASPTEQASAATEAQPGQPLVVKLEASSGDVWVRYQVDDAKPTTLILKQGTSQDLPPAQTHVTLNYGNRLTLKLKINNREANFPPDTPKFASQVVISRDNFKTFFQ